MRLPRPLQPASELVPDVPAAGVGLPGLGLSVDGWRRVAERLTPVAPLAVVATPAHGLPAAPRTALDPVTSADRLHARLGELGLLASGPLVLLGHSASCQVVAELARRHPAAVRGLVLVGPTTDPRASTWPRLAERWLRTAAHEDPRQVPQLVRDYSYSGLVTFARAMDAARCHDVRVPLTATTCPVLLVRGPRDRLAPASWLAHLAGCRPGIGTATTTTGGHMVPLTRPHELAAVVAHTLTR